MTEGRDLEGRRFVVTGAGRGIGRTVAKTLTSHGATTVLVSRTRADLLATAAEAGEERCEIVALDVTRELDWRAALGRVAPDGIIDGLVTAAGALGPIGPIGGWTLDEFRAVIDVNVMGTLTPIVVLLDSLRPVGASIVTFSGGGATSPLPRFDGYAASKAAVVRLTENLAADLAARGCRINSVAPGFIPTDIHLSTLAAGPELVGDLYFERTRAAMTGGGGDPPVDAADLTAFLLSDASAGITGKLISAKWDPWREPDFQDRLRAEPDLATLRRIDDQFFVSASPPK